MPHMQHHQRRRRRPAPGCAGGRVRTRDTWRAAHMFTNTRRAARPAPAPYLVVVGRGGHVDVPRDPSSGKQQQAQHAHPRCVASTHPRPATAARHGAGRSATATAAATTAAASADAPTAAAAATDVHGAGAAVVAALAADTAGHVGATRCGGHPNTNTNPPPVCVCVVCVSGHMRIVHEATGTGMWVPGGVAGAPMSTRPPPSLLRHLLVD